MKWIKFSERHPNLPAEEIVIRDFEGAKSLLNIDYDNIEEVAATQYEWLDETPEPTRQGAEEVLNLAIKNFKEKVELASSYEDDYNGGRYKMINESVVLAAMQSFSAQSEGWVSVEERLPEMGRRVLVYAPTENDKIQVDHRCKTGHKSGWSWDWCMNTEIGEHTVTHWRRLPAPPKA